jgi:hypothetical protein
MKTAREYINFLEDHGKIKKQHLRNRSYYIQHPLSVNKNTMNKGNLTEKQSELLKFIEEYQLSNGTSPIIAEMKAAMPLETVTRLLQHLVPVVD